MIYRITAAITILAFLLPGLSQPASAETEERAAQKAILVTGASSGIGRNLAERLAASGYFVYAGARKQADLDALNEIANIQAVRLDVTIQHENRRCREDRASGWQGLARAGQ